MKRVECSNCGSTELIADNDIIVCVYCRSRHVPQTDDVPPRETVIGIESDIQTLLQKCRQDPKNRRRFANLILDIDPSNQEAKKFLS